MEEEDYAGREQEHEQEAEQQDVLQVEQKVEVLVQEEKYREEVEVQVKVEVQAEAEQKVEAVGQKVEENCPRKPSNRQTAKSQEVEVAVSVCAPEFDWSHERNL